jgi:uncharacterized protein with GYD domain
MAMYFMFGKYSADAVKKISAERTKKATDIVKECGGQFKAVYALLGDIDAVAIADFPSVKQAMKASVELSKLLAISFTTVPAVTMEEFDKLFKER